MTSFKGDDNQSDTFSQEEMERFDCVGLIYQMMMMVPKLALTQKIKI
jgi:hypothetical protein